MSDEKALVPVEQPLYDALGVDSSAQLQRIGRDLVLSEVASGVVVMASPLDDNPYANPQEMTSSNSSTAR